MDAAADLQIVRFTVEPAYRGWRLDRYLCAKIRGLSRAKAQAMILSSPIADRPVKPSTFIEPGMVLTLTRTRPPEPPTPESVTVVHRDASLLVVDKPAGLPMHPGGCYRDGTLVARIRALALDGEKPDPAHRLDRETSGLVVCGLHPAATRALKLAFMRGEIRKTYLAVTEGAPEEDRFEVDLPLSVGDDLVRVRARGDPTSGKPSTTRFTVLRRCMLRGERFALLRCEPLTGRQHQIRVHLAAKGFPIVGDKLYRDERVFLRFIDKALTDEDRAMLRLPRHALHAAGLSLRHPTTGETMTFESPLPSELTEFLE